MSALFDPDEITKFDKLAEQWWDAAGPLKTLHDINPLRVSYIQQHAGPLSGLRIADVGCGGGILAESLALLGASVTGIDRAADAIEAARRHSQGLPIDITYHAGDVNDFAASHPGQFDIVTCMEMLEHVPEPDAIIQACATLMKPGGHFFASTLNRTPKAYGLAVLVAEYVLNILPKKTHDYKKFITPSELAYFCRRNALTVRDVTGVQYIPCTRTASLVSDLSVNYLLYAQATNG